MASEELTISIGARDSGALSTIKQLNNQLKFLDKEYSLAQKSSKTFDSSLQGQKTKLEYLKNSYTVTAQKLDKYKKNQNDYIKPWKKIIWTYLARLTEGR